MSSKVNREKGYWQAKINQIKLIQTTVNVKKQL